jgi:hypothetical protein
MILAPRDHITTPPVYSDDQGLHYQFSKICCLVTIEQFTETKTSLLPVNRSK